METKDGVVEVIKPGASVEQKRYGKILDIAMKAGLLVLVVTFVLYLVGIPKPFIEKQDVYQNWGLKLHDFADAEKTIDNGYLGKTRITPGWTWTTHLNQSDFLTFAPIAFLASVTVICYLAILPIFLKRKDYIYTVLVVAEVLVLVLAASGLLKSGGH